VKLEEAREIVQNMRNRGRALNKEGDILSEIAIALIILDDRITELEAQRDELVVVCKKAAARQSQALDKMEKHNIVIDDLDNIHQKAAFTFYSMLVQTRQEIEAVLEAQEASDKEDKGNDNTTDVRRKPGQIDYGTGG